MYTHARKYALQSFEEEECAHAIHSGKKAMLALRMEGYCRCEVFFLFSIETDTLIALRQNAALHYMKGGLC